MMTPSLGLALGSGGARGLCHIGVLQAMVARGRPPDAVAGSSMGALVGACYGAGRLGALEDWARSLTRLGSLWLWDVDLRSGGLIKARALDRLFRDIELPDRIEDLALPFCAVATDMTTGGPVNLREGSLFDAVRASIALPGLISPHRHRGRWLIDGGVVDPIPVGAVRALGADVVIASNPNARLDGVIWTDHLAQREGGAPDPAPSIMAAALSGLLPRSNPAPGPSYAEVVTAGIEIMMDHVQRSRLAGDPPHVQLNGQLGDISIADLHEAARAIDEGHAMVERQFEFIAALVSDAPSPPKPEPGPDADADPAQPSASTAAGAPLQASAPQPQQAEGAEDT